MERVIVMHQPWDAAVKARIAQIMRNERPASSGRMGKSNGAK
jgi:hypothetical protein